MVQQIWCETSAVTWKHLSLNNLYNHADCSTSGGIWLALNVWTHFGLTWINSIRNATRFMSHMTSPKCVDSKESFTIYPSIGYSYTNFAWRWAWPSAYCGWVTNRVRDGRDAKINILWQCWRQNKYSMYNNRHSCISKWLLMMCTAVKVYKAPWCQNHTNLSMPIF